MKRSGFTRKPPKQKLNADGAPVEKKAKKPRKKRQAKLPFVRTAAAIVSEECAEYREGRSEFVCEVKTFLSKEPTARHWIDDCYNANIVARKTEVHHIWGRGRAPELGWFCSLILVHGATHRYGHDVSPYALEICSIVAKYELGRRQRDLEEVLGVGEKNRCHSRRHWNLAAMNAAVKAGTGCVSLAGRIEGVLLPKLVGAKFHEMGLRILGIIQKEEHGN